MPDAHAQWQTILGEGGLAHAVSESLDMQFGPSRFASSLRSEAMDQQHQDK
jgi:hypothetical protein